jgi:uncharacterized protein (DUF433 family)
MAQTLTSRFPLIEFRSQNGDRVACLKDRLEVWQVVMIAQGYRNDIAKTAAHLDLLPEQVESALRYYKAYPEEVDLAISQNQQGFDRLQLVLPQIERITLTNEDMANASPAQEL